MPKKKTFAQSVARHHPSVAKAIGRKKPKQLTTAEKIKRAKAGWATRRKKTRALQKMTGGVPFPIMEGFAAMSPEQIKEFKETWNEKGTVLTREQVPSSTSTPPNGPSTSAGSSPAQGPERELSQTERLLARLAESPGSVAAHILDNALQRAANEAVVQTSMQYDMRIARGFLAEVGQHHGGQAGLWQIADITAQALARVLNKLMSNTVNRTTSSDVARAA